VYGQTVVYDLGNAQYVPATNPTARRSFARTVLINTKSNSLPGL
jgi:hypothetical protein